MGFISEKVQIWRNPGIDIQKAGEPPFQKKEGPYYGLSKSEVNALSAKIMAELSEKIDWKNPDEVRYIKPRYTPAKQVVKMSGKK